MENDREPREQMPGTKADGQYQDNGNNMWMTGIGSSKNGHAVYAEPLWFIQTKSIIYYILGVVEVLLAFRFLFKLFGAYTGSGFVVFLYALTGILVAPFAGIFGTVVSPGPAVQFVFEPATLVAMAVYAVIARGLVSLARLRLAGRH